MLSARLKEIGVHVPEEALPRLWTPIQKELEQKRRALSETELCDCVRAALAQN